MNTVFETMGDGVRAAFDAGQRTQEAFWRNTQEAWKRPADVDRFIARGAKMMREWVPLVSRNLDTFAEACDMNLRRNIDVLKNTMDVATHADEGDLYAKSRQLWDSAFDTMRANFEMMAKATSRTMEACSSFCDAVGCCEETGKSGMDQGRHTQNAQPQRPVKQHQPAGA